MAVPNTRASADHYMPILKGKMGELGALATAPRSHLLPLVEITEPSKAMALAKAWTDPDHVVLVQALNLDETDEPDWASEVEKIFGELRSSDVAAVPVVTPHDDSIITAILRRVIAIDQRGASIRIDAEDAAAMTAAAMKATIDRLLAELSLGPGETDPIIDVGIVRDSVPSRVAAASSALAVLPHFQDWRNLITAFSAFPDVLGEVAEKGKVTSLPRDDAIAYAVLVEGGLKRQPLFGDHAVGVPFYADTPWAPIPAIRYTSNLKWMVHRGMSKDGRSAQYVELSGDVASAAHYAGTSFSDKDKYYADVATAAVGPGNPTTFVRANTSHHLAAVLDRLATLGVP